MVPFQTKGGRFLPWTDRGREVEEDFSFRNQKRTMSAFQFDPKKEIFQFTEQLKEAIRSKNQSIIGSGLLN